MADGAPAQDYKQATRRIALKSSLGDDVLVVTELDSVEEFSRLSTHRVQMLSQNDDIKPEEIVGKPVTIVMLDVDDKPYYLRGYFKTFINHGRGDRATIYSGELVPWLWFLTRRTNCRMFQDKTVPEIIEEVFKDLGFTDYDFSGLSGSFAKRVYTVQYRESDFDFVSRLMEDEGIFYYFKHEADRDLMCMANHTGAYQQAKHSSVRYVGPQSFREVDDDLLSWQHRYEYRSGKIMQHAFNFETPERPIDARANTVLKLENSAAFELYDYPGNYLAKPEGEADVKVRMEEEEAPFDIVIGSSKCRSFSPGYTFSVEEHHQEQETRKNYVITSVRHYVTAGSFVSGGEQPEAYRNEFTCIPAATVYRPPRSTPKSLVRGPQTALVVGPSGEEIYTDKYGRVKVKFHWDREPWVDDKSSCWLRVAQVWAGKNWGAMFIPRIGQEVIVDFLEGDPDQPIIVGRVYNAECMPPYELEANKNLSGIKTLSTKGGEGFNELRFDDKKGEEQIFIHAERNFDVRIKKDRFEWVENDQHLIVKNKKFEHVKVDRHTKVDQDDVVKLGRDQHVAMDGKRAVKIAQTESLTVQGNVTEVFQANQSTQITGSLYIKAANTVIEATGGLTIMCGGSSVVIDPSGVTLKGPMVTLDGGMTKINSGPGSPAASGVAGSAVSPTAAEAALEADQADPGEVTAVKERQKETGKGKYGVVPPPQFVQKPPMEQDPTKTSWIEIQLVDEANQPVPGERVRLLLPDGSEYSTTLDENGLARVEGIDPGNCQITFPNLDREACQRA